MALWNWARNLGSSPSRACCICVSPVRHAFLVHLGNDLVDGFQLPGAFEQRIERALAGQEADAVPEGVLFMERAQVRVQARCVRLGDDQRHLLRTEVDLIDGGERQQALIAVPLGRIEDLGETLLELLRGLVTQIGAPPSW